MLQAELKILGGKHQGKLIPLSTKKFLVGREQDCHLRPNSDLVSRHHCVFSIDDYAVRLRDLGSTNGTRVNGENLRGEVILKAGDKIGIGKLELELVVRQASPVVTPISDTSSGSGELDAVPSGATVELPSFTDDSNAEGIETSFELPVMSVQATQDTSTSLANDTSIIPGSAPGVVYPGYAPVMPQGYPGAMPPLGYGMPSYPQPAMPYPGQYPPGYGQPMYQNMPGYQMPMPAVGYPVPAAPVPSPAEPATQAAAAVKLPPPESTGFKEAPAPVAPSNPPAGGSPQSAEKPSTSAADIIKQYMQKRTR